MDVLKGIKSRPGYKWVVAAACFAMVMICLGFCSSTKQIYLAAVTDALNIERAAYSVNDSIRFIATSVMGILFGTLVMRFGPRKLIGLGFASLVASMLVYSVATQMWQFYVGGALLGIGLSTTGTAMVGYVITHWFAENKGTVMGFVLAANGIGGAVSVQIVSPIINAHSFGFRDAYRVTAIILAVLAVVVVILMKNEPEGVTRSAPKKKKARDGTWSGITFQECLKKPYFYVAVVCIFMFGMVIQGSNGVYAAHMRDIGLDHTYVATVMSVHALVLTVFKVLAGFSYDKFGLRVTYIICNVAGVAMMLLLASLTNTPQGVILAMCQGVISSLAMPIETVLLPLLTAELFGEKSFAQILGIMTCCTSLGYAVGAPLSNAFYDAHGTYFYGLLLCAGLMLATSIVIQFVISAAHRQRDRLAAMEQ